MAKFQPQRKQGCATQFGATSSPCPPAEDLNTPLIILDSHSEMTSDNDQKVAGELKMQFSPASEDIDPLLLVDDKTTEDLKMNSHVIPSSAPSLPSLPSISSPTYGTFIGVLIGQVILRGPRQEKKTHATSPF